jgi:hypothetical protein
LIDLINSIQFDETDHCLFEHLQYAFFSNSLLSFESEINCKNNHMVLFSENLEDYLRESQKYQEIKFLFEVYPIFLPTFLEIESNNQTELFFTGDQMKLVEQFKYIEVFTGTGDSFCAKSRSLREDHLFIFVPTSITSLAKRCFKGCSSLTQINIPNSITSIDIYCF